MLAYVINKTGVAVTKEEVEDDIMDHRQNCLWSSCLYCTKKDYSYTEIFPR